MERQQTGSGALCVIGHTLGVSAIVVSAGVMIAAM